MTVEQFLFKLNSEVHHVELVDANDTHLNYYVTLDAGTSTQIMRGKYSEYRVCNFEVGVWYKNGEPTNSAYILLFVEETRKGGRF